MSWLGNGFREQAQALSDASASMYAPNEEEQQQEEEKVEQEKLQEGEAKHLSKDCPGSDRRDPKELLMASRQGQTALRVM